MGMGIRRKETQITVISTYPQMEEYFKRNNFKGVKILVKTINDIYDIKKFIKENENKTDVFISRGATVNIIKEMTDVAVVKVLTTNYDLIRALYKAKKKGEKRVGVLSYYKDKYDFEEIEKILNMKIINYKYNSTVEVEGKINILKEQEIKTIIGGGVTPGNAAKVDVEGILLESSDESIENAVSTCKKIALVRNKEKNKNARLKAILESINQGILVTDEEDNIIVYNKQAENILNIPREKVMMKNVKESIPNTKLHEINLTGQAEVRELQEINSEIIATSRIPIMLDGRRVGVVGIFDKSSNIQKLEKKIREKNHEKGLVAKYTFNDIVTQNKDMITLKELVKLYAETEETILINGESGTGKELFAQSIHNASLRRDKPFVAVNCAAISENILESELFGYTGGVFTGAKKEGKMGLFELANTGTIFLDEIGEISKKLQGSLLRVIQEKEVMRVGGERIIPVDIRIICATNKNLREEVNKDKFREDLYYRLNVFNFKIPPLRERIGDAPLIVKKILEKYDDEKNIQLVVNKISNLKGYWQGNIRELESIARRIYFIVKKGELKNIEKYLNIDLRQEENPIEIKVPIEGSLKDIVSVVEGRVIAELQKENYKMEEILEKLKISRATYMRKK